MGVWGSPWGGSGANWGETEHDGGVSGGVASHGLPWESWLSGVGLYGSPCYRGLVEGGSLSARVGLVKGAGLRGWGFRGWGFNGFNGWGLGQTPAQGVH